MSAPKHEIVWLPIKDVKPYENNAKKHPPEQVARLVKMLAKGFDQPIVVDANYVIIKGHGRLAAAKKLKLKQVPVIVRRDLSEDEVKAHRIGDNKNAESEFDLELLKIDMDSLVLTDVDLDLTGFPDWNPADLEAGQTHVEGKEQTGSKELSEGDFQEFSHQCPRCGFEFDR